MNAITNKHVTQTVPEKSHPRDLRNGCVLWISASVSTFRSDTSNSVAMDVKKLKLSQRLARRMWISIACNWVTRKMGFFPKKLSVDTWTAVWDFQYPEWPDNDMWNIIDDMFSYLENQHFAQKLLWGPCMLDYPTVESIRPNHGGLKVYHLGSVVVPGTPKQPFINGCLGFQVCISVVLVQPPGLSLGP